MRAIGKINLAFGPGHLLDDVSFPAIESVTFRGAEPVGGSRAHERVIFVHIADIGFILIA